MLREGFTGPRTLGLYIFFLAVLAAMSQSVITKILTIKTCGKPNIQNIMNNVTAKPGQSATFKCQVDMSCIVAYIEWYHEMDNGTEKLIKTASSSGDPHVHIIKEVKPTDEGLYTCIAGNVLGQATASAYLEVNKSSYIQNNFLLLSFCVIILLLFQQPQEVTSSSQNKSSTRISTLSSSSSSSSSSITISSH